MARVNEEIPSILQKLWDTELKNQNIMLILCGSSMSYIEKQILSEKIRFMEGLQEYLRCFQCHILIQQNFSQAGIQKTKLLLIPFLVAFHFI